MSLRLAHRLIFCTSVFSCPVGNACLVLFRLAGVIDILSRGADCLAEGRPYKHTTKPSEVYAGFEYQGR
jgi:hypothetical protein